MLLLSDNEILGHKQVKRGALVVDVAAPGEPAVAEIVALVLKDVE